MPNNSRLSEALRCGNVVVFGLNDASTGDDMIKFPANSELRNAILAALKAMGGAGTFEEVRNKVIEQLNLPEEVTKATRTLPPGSRQNELSHRLMLEFSRMQLDGVAEHLWSLKRIAKPAKPAQPVVAFPIPSCSPFPPSSDFAKIFAILYAHRQTGISMEAFVLCYRRWSLKDKPQADFDLGSFISLGKTGGWIVERNGVVFLVTDAAATAAGTSRSQSSKPIENVVCQPPVQQMKPAKR